MKTSKKRPDAVSSLDAKQQRIISSLALWAKELPFPGFGNYAFREVDIDFLKAAIAFGTVAFPLRLHFLGTKEELGPYRKLYNDLQPAIERNLVAWEFGGSPRIGEFDLDVWEKESAPHLGTLKRLVGPLRRTVVAFSIVERVQEPSSFHWLLDSIQIDETEIWDWHFLYPYFSLYLKAIRAKVGVPAKLSALPEPAIRDYFDGKSPNAYDCLEALYPKYADMSDPLTKLAAFEHDLWELRSLCFDGYLEKKAGMYKDFEPLVADYLSNGKRDIIIYDYWAALAAGWIVQGF